MTDCYVSLDSLLSEPGRQTDHITFALVITMNAFTMFNYANDREKKSDQTSTQNNTGERLRCVNYGLFIYVSLSVPLSVPCVG